ncbi:MAG TPA: superoxide dismutase [Chitinophagaceae bacterium]|nr:superoxide dismutase [Chitinophagaceae bacterium]
MEQYKDNGRRKFIITSARAGLAIGIGSGLMGSLASCSSTRRTTAPGQGQTGFQQTALPYAYSALEPVIDSMTMEIHYSRHAAGYATNLQQAAQAEGVDVRKPLEDVLSRISKFSTKMRNNAGGHYNHELFWRCMRNRVTDNRPSGTLLQALETSFGSFGNFKNQFADAARNRFGSGWAWLVKDASNKLSIGSTPNQDNPLMDVSDLKGFPLLGIDVWEHAYYLKYQNKRADYIDNWWNIVNWDFVQQRFAV